MIKFRWETEFKKTEIGEIPREWVIDLLKKISYINKKRDKKECPKYRFISMEDIPTDGRYPDFKETNREDIKSGVAVFPDQILLAKITPSFEHGKTCIVPNDNEFCWFATTEVFTISPKDKTTDKWFLFYLLKQKDLREILEGSMTGTSGRQRVQLSALKNLVVPLPPLPEQSRIATVLSWFDNLIENKKRQNEILEKTAMAIFKSWFVDFEPFKDGEFVYSEELDREVPKGWEVEAICEVAELESGGNAPQSEIYFENGKYPFIRVKHMSTGSTVYSYDLINDKAIERYRLKLYPEGVIIFQKSGESLKKARVNILPFDAYIVNHIAILQPKTQILREFLFHYMKILLFHIVRGESGTALPYINISTVKSKFIPINSPTFPLPR